MLTFTSPQQLVADCQSYLQEAQATQAATGKILLPKAEAIKDGKNKANPDIKTSAGKITLPAGPDEKEIYEAAPIAALLHIPRSQAEDILAACKEFVAEQETAKARLNKSLNKTSSSRALDDTTPPGANSATAQLAAQLFDESEYDFIEESESFAAEDEIEYGEKK